MSSETIQLPSARPSWREQPSLLGDAVVILLAGLIALLGVAVLDQRPTRLDQLTVDNPSDYELIVEVHGAEPGWMPLATVGPHKSVPVTGPIDQGDTWYVRFSGQGRVLDPIVVRRDDLRDNGWHLAIPDLVGAQLRDQGAPASPQR